jgi:hypothetical protein
MVSMPLVVLLGVLTWFLIKKFGAKSWHMIVGVMFGLTLAATPLGAQCVTILNSASAQAIAALSHVAGA